MFLSAEFRAYVAWAVGMSAAGAVRYFGDNINNQYLQPVTTMHPVIFWSVTTGLVALVARRLAIGRPLPRSVLKADLTGKTIIVTGSSAGCGYHSALFFATHGATVVLANRSVARNEDTAARLRAEPSAQGKDLKLISRHSYDAEDLNSVKKFAETFLADSSNLPPLSVLMNNAGLINGDAKIFCSKHHPEIEYTACINCYAPVLLTELLMNKIREDKTRVVNLSSFAHNFVPSNRPIAESVKSLYFEEGAEAAAKNPVAVKKQFDTVGREFHYGVSKLVNHMHSHYLVSQGVDAVSLHPGFVSSNFYSKLPIPEWFVNAVAPYLGFKTSAEGAYTQIYASILPEADAKAEKKIFENDLKKGAESGKFVNREAVFYCDSTIVNKDFMSKNGRDLDAANAIMEFMLAKIKKNYM